LLFAFDKLKRRRLQSAGDVGLLLIPLIMHFEQSLPLFQQTPAVIGDVARQSLERRRHFNRGEQLRSLRSRRRAWRGLRQPGTHILYALFQTFELLLPSLLTLVPLALLACQRLFGLGQQMFTLRQIAL